MSGEQLLGVALSALMRVPAERRAELHLQALKRIALAPENDWRRFLLAECLEAYAGLDETERQRIVALLKNGDLSGGQTTHDDDLRTRQTRRRAAGRAIAA